MKTGSEIRDRLRHACCGNCVFFNSVRHGAHECRKGPPVRIRGAVRVHDGWPVVSQIDWCGEYTHKEDK